MKGSDTGARNSSIFDVFARPGQQPVQYSYRAHTTPEARYVFSCICTAAYELIYSSARIVKWVTENNRPANIVKDRELRELLCAGRPTLDLPSPNTVARDIQVCFKKCQERVGKLLHVCDEWIIHSRFSTDIGSRTMRDVSTLQPMRGPHQIIEHLLHGPST
jgi:hypothetical protein